MEDVFFSLLRSGLYGQPVPQPELPDAIDWRAIGYLAEKHAVQGIIIESVELLPDHLRPPKQVASKMAKFAIGLIQANLVIDKTAARLASFFEPHGIHGVLLKGQGVSRYYRNPQMRHNGDIDFYVGQRAYKQAVSLCRRHLVENEADCHETSQHYDFLINKIPIEIHRLATRVYVPWRNKPFQRWIIEQLEHSPARRTLAVDGVDIAIPSYEFDAIYIFYHAWRHFITGGIGLRQLCDWAMVFHSHYADIDTDALVDNIRRFGLTNGWKLFACIAIDRLGLPAEKMPLYDPAFAKRSAKALQEILDGGNFGFYTEAYRDKPTSRFSPAYAARKLRNTTRYFLSLFPLMPLEASFLYLHRLSWGVTAVTKRALSKK